MVRLSGFLLVKNACVAWLATLVLVLAFLPGARAEAPEKLTAAQARHFLLRTGFAPTQAEIDARVGKPGLEVIGRTLAEASQAQPSKPWPEFMQQPAAAYPPGNQPDEQRAWRQQQQRETQLFKAWWMAEMIATPAPLQERMVLFWHNHFATSQQKVLSSQAMSRQQQTLRSQALGNFGALLHRMARDPAMLVYLDGATSRKEAPNENFAREVMELFTLGEASQGGSYTEQDIREAARALTGWSVNRSDYTLQARPAFHDNGSKTIFGKTGNFDAPAVLDILLEQPQTARFITTKLWREFVSPTLNPVRIERLARRFQASGYDIATVLEGIFTSDEFWAESNRATLVKSPVELIVGTVRQFGFEAADTTPFVIKAAQLGQNLLLPPNVKGWPGQNDWINATTLLERRRFTEQLSRNLPNQDAATVRSLTQDAAYQLK